MIALEAWMRATVPAGYALGAVVGAVVWRATRSVFSIDVFRRTNYRGHELTTSVGLVIALVALAGGAVVQLRFLGGAAPLPPWAAATGQVSELAIGFALLGLLDDLAGVGESGGFRGHLAAMARGRLTTGGIKLAGGAALAVLVLGSPGSPRYGVVDVLRDGAIVSLGANLANLVDRAPGRVLKFGQGWFLLMVIATSLVGSRLVYLAPVAFVAGAALPLILPDLREEVMVGDAGSNVLGAVLGFGTVLAAPGWTGWIVLAVLLALNVASEVVSFTKVIDATPPLRWLDRLGSPHRS